MFASREKRKQSKILAVTVKNAKHWHLFKQLKLIINMRALQDTNNYAEWLLRLGKGNLDKVADQPDDIIEIPASMMLKNNSSLITEVFGKDLAIIDRNIITSSAILCTTNEDCLQINNEIIASLPEEAIDYYSIDSIETDDVKEATNYPVEFLNSIQISGLPPHKLTIKIGTVVMMIRNISKKNGMTINKLFFLIC